MWGLCVAVEGRELCFAECGSGMGGSRGIWEMSVCPYFICVCKFLFGVLVGRCMIFLDSVLMIAGGWARSLSDGCYGNAAQGAETEQENTAQPCMQHLLY